MTASPADSEPESAYSSKHSGILLVFSDPGTQASLEEFHDWYDNEHVPLRLPHFPSFKSGARYSVISSTCTSSSPTFQSKWSALYTISDNSVYLEPSYRKLRSNRSVREGELLSRIGVLDRRIYKCVYDSHPAGLNSKASLRPILKGHIEERSNTVVCTSVTPRDKELYDRWYLNEHVDLLKKVPGWTRTRRFELVDALIVGKDAGENKRDANDVPLCLGVHEYSNPNFQETREYQAALNTVWRSEVMGENNENILKQERRVMRLYRAWDPEAAIREAQQEEEEQGKGKGKTSE